jgi:hypothetical protein
MTNTEKPRAERLAREVEARIFHGRRHFAGIALRALIEIYGIAERSKVVGMSFDYADAMLAEEKSRYGY